MNHLNKTKAQQSKSNTKALRQALTTLWKAIYEKPAEKPPVETKSEKPSKDTAKPIKSEPKQSKTALLLANTISETKKQNLAEVEIKGLNFGSPKDVFTVKGTVIKYWVQVDRIPLPVSENETSENYKLILADWQKILKQYKVKKFQIEVWKMKSKLIDENKQEFDVVGSDKIGTFEINEPAIKRCLVSAIKSLLQKQEPKCELAKVEITLNENFTEFFADYNGQPFYDFYVI